MPMNRRTVVIGRVMQQGAFAPSDALNNGPEAASLLRTLLKVPQANRA
jgi:hypothetical protein